MRLLIAGLAFSILFSSLPTKVWACAFKLCPVTTYEKIAAEPMAPCHQNSKEVDLDADSMTGESPCPCPHLEYSTVSYPSHDGSGFAFETHDSETVGYLQTRVFSSLQLLGFHYHPPPIANSGHLYIIHQAFLI